MERLLAEIVGTDLVDGWAEANGLDEEVLGLLKGLAETALYTLTHHQMEELARQQLAQADDPPSEGWGVAIVGGHELMGPVAETIAISFFQIGWEAHKQYGKAASQPSG